ncbi:MAG: arginine--tRNA ligase, partial [Gemmatimonas sp.]
MTQADALRAELARAARTLGAPDDVTPILERPRDPSFGDWATNLAMTLAKALGKKPRDIAEALIAALDMPRVGIVSAEIAGPGFVNIRLDPGFQARGLLQILRAPDQWGRVALGHGERVCVEFVSANPTGPLHVGHGRQAALGDAISTLLEWTGFDVDREFYYNDAGAQIANLAKSTQARVRELAGQPLQIPEGGYHGAYIGEIAERYVQ